MKHVDAAKLNKALTGYTELIRFDLKRDDVGFRLKLALGNEGKARVTLVCRDVQNLELNPAGNGFARLIRLEVTDMREDGLERIHFSVEEVERETLFLHCAEIELGTD
jgi:hypothetical protein